ncbi:transposon Ty3-I Gag-Pol polyprotein, partial [Trichonephila clavipes]
MCFTCPYKQSTRYAITKALPTAEVDEIAKFLLEEIVLRHGAPRVIITDRGAVFRSKLVSSLVDLCNIDHRFTTAYHPQTNGLTERFNKTLADMLSMYVDVEQKNWDEILPFVTFAYNTAKQETTGFTPFYLLHGREAETTLDTMLPFCPNDFDDNNITKIAARAEESRQLARVHTLRAQDKDRRRYDSKHQMVSYAPGDLVWVYTPVLDESRSFFRVHTGYFSNIPKCIKAEFIASWACSQSSVVSSSSVRINLIVCLIELCTSFELRDNIVEDCLILFFNSKMKKSESKTFLEGLENRNLVCNILIIEEFSTDYEDFLTLAKPHALEVTIVRLRQCHYEYQ